MQKYFLIIFQMLVLGKVCAQTTTQDSLAIIKLLEKEGATWRMGDAKGHSECWAVKPNGRVLISTTEGKSLDFSSDRIANAPASMMTGGGFSIHSNYKMSIGNTSAWVIHDEVSIGKDGKETLSHEVRMLEKMKGQWKLVGQSNHQYNPEKPKTDTQAIFKPLILRRAE